MHFLAHIHAKDIWHTSHTQYTYTQTNRHTQTHMDTNFTFCTYCVIHVKNKNCIFGTPYHKHMHTHVQRHMYTDTHKCICADIHRYMHISLHTQMHMHTHKDVHVGNIRKLLLEINLSQHWQNCYFITSNLLLSQKQQKSLLETGNLRKLLLQFHFLSLNWQNCYFKQEIEGNLTLSS